MQSRARHYSLSLHVSLPISIQRITSEPADFFGLKGRGRLRTGGAADIVVFAEDTISSPRPLKPKKDRKSTRLNSSHGYISYAVPRLKKKHSAYVPGVEQPFF